MSENNLGEHGRTRLVLLGTGGGPTIHKNTTRHGPANVVLVDDVPYLVDAGEGAPRQFVRAKLDLTTVGHIFITHQHFDHNSELGNFVAYQWFAGRREPVDIWGPPRLNGLMRDYISQNSFDFELREKETGRPPFHPIPRTHEFDMEGPLRDGPIVALLDERVTVRAMRVNHGLVPAVAYRFTTPDLEIVFSGDRGGEDDIAAFSKGADILVHEVLHYEAMLETFPNAPEAVLRHYREDHTSPQDVGRVATEAGVKTVVLNHVLPDNDLVSDDEWVKLVRETFDGDVILSTDLMEL